MGHSFRPRPPPLWELSSGAQSNGFPSGGKCTLVWCSPLLCTPLGPPGHRVALPIFRVEWVFPPHVSKCRNSHSHTRTEVSLLCDYTSCQVVNVSHSSHVTWKNLSPWRASLCPPFLSPTVLPGCSPMPPPRLVRQGLTM